METKEGDTNLKICLFSAKEDSKFLKDLNKHLRPIAKYSNIEIWSQEEIQAGQSIKETIKQRLDEADIIMPLISADFLNDEYFENLIIPKIISETKDKVIIPVLVRACAWEKTHLEKIRILPSDEVPINSSQDKDEAYKKIVNSIKTKIDNLTIEKEIETALKKFFHYRTIGIEKPEKSDDYKEIYNSLLKNSESKLFTSQAFEILGFLYKNGLGIEKNINEAKKYYLKSAKMGNQWGQNGLGNIYLEQKDYAEATKWFKKSGLQGNYYSLHALGNFHLNGQGVTKNEKIAIEYFLRSAIRGYPRAYYTLGKFFSSRDLSDEIDYETAILFFKKAKELGFDDQKIEIKINEIKKLKDSDDRIKDITLENILNQIE